MNWTIAFYAVVGTFAIGAIVTLGVVALEATIDGNWRRFTWACIGVLAIIGTAAGLAPWSTDGVHEWDGGSGPDTVCRYEVRYVKANPYSVTVCTDQGVQR